MLPVTIATNGLGLAVVQTPLGLPAVQSLHGIPVVIATNGYGVPMNIAGELPEVGTPPVNTEAPVIGLAGGLSYIVNADDAYIINADDAYLISEGVAARDPREPDEGETLLCTTGEWTGTEPITYTYQWYRVELPELLTDEAGIVLTDDDGAELTT